MRPLNYWTKEKCIESARDFDQIRAWSRKFSGAYNAAVRNGWLDECVVHISRRTPNGYWTKERCLENALKYSRVSDWQKNSQTALNTAFTNGWYAECTAHMKKNSKREPKPATTKRHSGYWNKERVLKSLEGFTSIGQWSKKYSGAYFAAKINNYIEECRELVRKNFERQHGPCRLPYFKITEVPRDFPLVQVDRFAPKTKGYIPPLLKEKPKPPTIKYKDVELIESGKTKGCKGCYFNLYDDCLTSGLVCSNKDKDIIFEKYEN